MLIFFLNSKKVRKDFVFFFTLENFFSSSNIPHCVCVVYKNASFLRSKENGYLKKQYLPIIKNKTSPLRKY